MSDRKGELVQVTSGVLRTAQDERVTFLAAGIAYYAFMSIFPLLLLILVIGSALGGEAFAESIVSQISDVLTPEAEGLLEEALAGDEGRGGAGIVGVAVLLWSSLRVFRGLDIAFTEIYTGTPEPSFLETVRNGLLVLGSIAVAAIALLLIRGYLHFLDLPPVVIALSPLLLFITLAIVFYPIYMIFPNDRFPTRYVLPGTLFAALGWTLLAELFGLYAANAGSYAVFGLIGAVLLLLVWFYFGAVVMLLGAVINAVLVGTYRDADDPDTPAPPGKTNRG